MTATQAPSQPYPTQTATQTPAQAQPARLTEAEVTHLADRLKATRDARMRAVAHRSEIDRRLAILTAEREVADTMIAGLDAAQQKYERDLGPHMTSSEIAQLADSPLFAQTQQSRNGHAGRQP